MALDPYIFVLADLTDVELTAAERIVQECLGPAPDFSDCGEPDAWLRRSEYAPDVVELFCHARYFEENYQRGWWPTIVQGLNALRAAFPEAEVYYGHDSLMTDEISPLTAEREDALWVAFLSAVATSTDHELEAEWWQGIPAVMGSQVTLSRNEAKVVRALAAGWASTTEVLFATAKTVAA